MLSYSERVIIEKFAGFHVCAGRTADSFGFMQRRMARQALNVFALLRLLVMMEAAMPVRALEAF
jgi:hypothetical protein